MGYTFQLIRIAFMILVLAACGSETQKVEEKKKPVITFDDPVIPSAKFTSFVNGFETGLTPNKYDQQWLESFLDNEQVREISPKVCEEFIYNKEVLNVGFQAKEKKRLSADKPYYYIGQIADTGNYIILIFTDLEEKATETFLCTYTKGGQFISGIVLQANYLDLTNPKSPEKSERTCRIPANSKPMLQIEETSVDKPKKMTTYSIAQDGQIRLEQQSS